MAACFVFFVCLFFVVVSFGPKQRLGVLGSGSDPALIRQWFGPSLLQARLFSGTRPSQQWRWTAEVSPCSQKGLLKLHTSLAGHAARHDLVLINQSQLTHSAARSGSTSGCHNPNMALKSYPLVSPSSSQKRTTHQPTRSEEGKNGADQSLSGLIVLIVVINHH